MKHTITNTLSLIGFSLSLFALTTLAGFTVAEVADAQQPTYTYVSSTPSHTREPLPTHDPEPLTGDLATEDTSDPAPAQFAPQSLTYTDVPAPVSAPLVAPQPVAATPMPKVAPQPILYATLSPEVVVEDAPTATTCEEDMPCWDCATMGNKQCGPISTPAPAPICYEDMPCWDCSTMGNRICGPTVAPNPVPPAPSVPSIPPYTDEVPPTAPPVVCKGNCPTDPFIPPVHSEPNPETPIDCATIQPGEAWAGVGQVCNFNPVGH